MENENNKDSFTRRRFLEIGSAALTTAGLVSATAASAMAQEQQNVEKGQA